MQTVAKNMKKLIAKAAEIIAPLWPMQTIIARNPLQGIESLNFEDAIAIGNKFFSPSLKVEESSIDQVNQEMIKWCQAFLDEGQATIVMPEREKGFYSSWAGLAPFDSRLKPLKENKWLLSLPLDPEEAIIFCLKRMNIPEDEIEEYLKYSLAELPGWAGYIKWRAEWQNKEAGLKNPITITDFLAVRLVITCAIQGDGGTIAFKRDVVHLNENNKKFINDLKNKEENYLEMLLKSLIPEAQKLSTKNESDSIPQAQIVFCIDVRSEPFRKRIEAQGNYETFGFAGFFGLPVSVHCYNTKDVKDLCPVLLKPKYEVFEEPKNKGDKRIYRHLKGLSFLDMCRKFYEDLKYNFATPFALVETLGLCCGFWMALRTLMPVRSVKFRRSIQHMISPEIETIPKIEIPLTNQIILAESGLKMIGLTKNFSPLVVLCGHGSQTENNPYASALDCGACGGNHGGPNGKILAAILNSCDVRAALFNKGIAIPQDTLFLGAQHNTTTDDVVIDDSAIINDTHKERIEKLKTDFSKAGLLSSQYRCKAFGLDTSLNRAKNHVLSRSTNWAEVRPEWGLARNAAFIVGPRDLTKDLNLDGRSFLHSYEWELDQDGSSLEAILTAPMVVAEWINTQYFFSTLNNTVYGSGSKITHNVTGKFGIMQGNSSDLMQGLPLQSVNSADDKSYHELLRLQVVVYAPCSKIDPIVEKHSILQTLFFNEWVVLVAVDPHDNKPYRLTEKGKWVDITFGNRSAWMS